MNAVSAKRGYAAEKMEGFTAEHRWISAAKNACDLPGLVNVYSLLWKMTHRNRWFTYYFNADFYSYVTNYQRVTGEIVKRCDFSKGHTGKMM